MKEYRKMNKLTKSLFILIVLIILIGMIGVQIGLGQVEAAAFPESHKQMLGASSYRSLFGLKASVVKPGPHSSDTGTGRPPRVGPNILINDPQLPLPDGLLGRSETTIAASGNGKFLLAGWNDADGFCGPPFNAPCTPPAVPGLSGYAYSYDGGQTWTDGGAPFVVSTSGGDKVTRGDPAMDVGGYGNDTFYYANLAVDTTSPSPGIGGMTVHAGSFSAFLDKELIAVDKRGRSDSVYVSVTNFKEVAGIPFFGFGQIEVYYSTDGAATFNRSIVQPDETISVPLNEGIINQGSEPAVGPDGTVYIAWERGFLSPFYGQAAAGVYPQIVAAASSDGGVTWTPRVLVSDICAGALFPPAGYNRDNTNEFPRIAVAQNGPYRGRVYVVYQDCQLANGGTQAETGGFGNADTDIYLSYSDDKGATWSTPTLVAGGADGLIQFWPTVSIQPGGNLDITYYESEEVDGTSLVDLYWAQSIDGGDTFESPVRVTEVTTDWGATNTNIIPNFGDYNTAVSAGNRLFATWADGRNGVPDTFFAKIRTIGKAPR
jgi:hypothetical protein